MVAGVGAAGVAGVSPSQECPPSAAGRPTSSASWPPLPNHSLSSGICIGTGTMPPPGAWPHTIGSTVCCWLSPAPRKAPPPPATANPPAVQTRGGFNR